MRLLVIEPETRRQAAHLMDFASKNIYRPEAAAKVPGDDERFVLKIKMGYRCVFTYTAVKGKLYRHLSISVNGPNYPHPGAVGKIAELFEFTGAGVSAEISSGQFPPTWILHMNTQEHCIVVAEELKDG